jgi:hypothetical protein
VKLGRLVRVILGKGILGRASMIDPVSAETAENILENAESLTRTPHAVTTKVIEALLGITTAA